MRLGYVSCLTLPEPDPDSELLFSVSRDAGLEAEFLPWDDPNIDLAQYDALVLRSCWNYHHHPDEFRQWVVAASEKAPLLNPPDVVEWNMDKGYLRDLELAGVPVVPTAFFMAGDTVDLANTAAAAGWQTVIVKPTVSAGSWMTMVFDPARSDAQTFLEEIVATRGAMVQPFLSSVKSVGERSVVWIAGEATHVVKKAPRFVGEEESVTLAGDPTQYESHMLRLALACAPSEVLYARLDLIQDDSGQWLVSELELIEPSLFFLQSPSSAHRFARALASRFAPT